MQSQTSNQTGQQVAADAPLMLAWKAYKETEAYQNTLTWCGKNNESSLWAAFCAGFNWTSTTDAPHAIAR